MIPKALDTYRAYRTWQAGGDAATQSFDDLARDRFIVGDPVAVKDEVARYRELGITTLILRMRWPGMDQATVLRSVRWFGERVLPHVV